MPNEIDRFEWERRIQAALDDVWRGRERELIELLGKAPDVSNIPSSFWVGLSAATIAALQPLLMSVATDSIMQTVEAEGLLDYGLDIGAVNSRAATWASKYTYSLVKGIDERTKAKLQSLVPNFFNDSTQDLKGLGSEIAKLFDSAVRGENIAISEVTRANAEGFQMLMREIKSENPKSLVAEFWQTSGDEIVCKFICVPLNGARGDSKGNYVCPSGPNKGVRYRFPAHPRCRCAPRAQIVMLKGAKNG